MGTGTRSKVMACVVAGSLVVAQAPFAFAQGPAAKPAAAHGAAPAAKAPADASAKPDLAAAKKHYGEGDRMFKAGDFAGAIVEFKAANDIKATAQTERFIGLCEDNLGHFRAASDWYDKFLAHVPEKLASQGDEIKKRNADLKAMPGKVHFESNPSGATVTVDDKAQGAPTPTDVDVPPGSHTIKLTAPGHVTASKSIDVEFATQQTVTMDLEAAAAPPPPPPAPVVAAVAAPVAVAPAATEPATPTEPRSKVPAFVTGGLAIAAAGVGTVFGVMALNDKSDFDKTPTTQIADNGDTHSLISDMCFGVAITFAVTSAVLFLTRDDAPSTASASGARKTAISIAPTPIVGPHSGGGGFVLKF